jgi:hypothetical protein
MVVVAAFFEVIHLRNGALFWRPSHFYLIVDIVRVNMEFGEILHVDVETSQHQKEASQCDIGKLMRQGLRLRAQKYNSKPVMKPRKSFASETVERHLVEGAISRECAAYLGSEIGRLKGAFEAYFNDLDEASRKAS